MVTTTRDMSEEYLRREDGFARNAVQIPVAEAASKATTRIPTQRNGVKLFRQTPRFKAADTRS